MSIYKEWLEAKKEESDAVARRREIEDKISSGLGIEGGDEGSRSFNADGYKITVTCRMNRRINSDKLQEIAAENGISEHLSRLFNWRPTISMPAWKAADENITTPLTDAITTTPGRPSYKIEKKEK